MCAFSIALQVIACGTAAAAPAGDALDRPSVMVGAPERSVLLAAAEAGSRLVAVGERGVIALSDDGGQQWQQAAAPTSVTLTMVRFADAQRGWAIGHGGTVLATTDGGRRWTRQLDGRRVAQTLLEAARAANDPKALAEAERLVADGPDKPWLDLLVIDAKRLLVVGAYGLALASDDGGQTWASWQARLPNPKGLHLYAVRQRGDALLIVGEQGLVMWSGDGGRSFRRLEAPYKGSFFAAEFIGAQDIVIAGLRGNVLRSNDAGATWSVLLAPMPVSITATAVDASGRLLAVNQAGFVMALQGDHFVPLNQKPLPPLNGLLARDGAVLALSIQGVLPLSKLP